MEGGIPLEGNPGLAIQLLDGGVHWEAGQHILWHENQDTTQIELPRDKLLWKVTIEKLERKEQRGSRK